MRDQTTGADPTHILISPDGFVDVAGRELVQLLIVAEDYHGNVDGAEDGELVRLLEQATLALEKGAIGVAGLVDAGETIVPDGTGTYTERFLSSLMALISIFRRPMVMRRGYWGRMERGGVVEQDSRDLGDGRRVLAASRRAGALSGTSWRTGTDDGSGDGYVCANASDLGPGQ